MKRTRIFLAAACTVMALAGVFATKANQKALSSYYYLNGNTCTFVNQAPPCELTSGISCADVQIFQSKVGSTCTTELFKNP